MDLPLLHHLEGRLKKATFTFLHPQREHIARIQTIRVDTCQKYICSSSCCCVRALEYLSSRCFFSSIEFSSLLTQIIKCTKRPWGHGWSTGKYNFTWAFGYRKENMIGLLSIYSMLVESSRLMLLSFQNKWSFVMRNLLGVSTNNCNLLAFCGWKLCIWIQFCCLIFKTHMFRICWPLFVCPNVRFLILCRVNTTSYTMHEW